MLFRVILLVALVAPARALVIGHPMRTAVARTAIAHTAAARTVAPRAEAEEENTPAARAQKAADFESLGAERRAAAAEQDFSAEEISALDAASKSKGPIWEGNMVDCPAGLKNALGTGSLDYFGQLRNPNKDPDPLTLEALRTKYPVLAGRSDEELLIALAPIKAVYVDRRSL